MAEHGRERLVQTQRALQLLELGLDAPALRIELDEDPDLAAEHDGIERLVQEIHAAGLVTPERAHGILRRRRHEDDRDRARAFRPAHQLGELEAVHSGHAHVDQSERDLMHEQQLERLVTGARVEQFEVRTREHRPDGSEVLRHVVDDEYLDRFVHAVLRPRAAAMPASACAMSFNVITRSAPARSIAAEGISDEAALAGSWTHPVPPNAADDAQPLGSVGIRARQHDCECTIPIRMSRRLEKHVDRGPRKIHRVVERQRERSPGFDEKMITGRRDIDGPAVRRLLVRRFQERERAARCQHAHEQIIVSRRDVYHDDDRRSERSRQRPEQHADCFDTTGGCADQDDVDTLSRALRFPDRKPVSAFAVDPHAGADFRECVGVRSEPQALFRSEPEKAPAHQRLAKQRDRAILELPVEIDQHVPTRDEMHLGEYVIGRQTVIGESTFCRSARSNTAAPYAA